MAFSEQGFIVRNLKLKPVGFLLAGLAILIVCYWGVGQYQTRQQHQSQTQALLRSLSVSLNHAMANEDVQLARQLLISLAEVQPVRSAALYNDEGILLAQYQAETNPGPLPAAPGTPGSSHEDSTFQIFHPLGTDKTNPTNTLFLSLSFKGDAVTGSVPAILILLSLAFIGWGYKSLGAFSSGLTSRKSDSAAKKTESSNKRTIQKLKEHSPAEETHPPVPALDRQDLKLLEMEERLKLEILIRKQGEEILKTHHRILEHLAVGNSLEKVLDLVSLNLNRQILPDTISAIYMLDEDRTELTLLSAPQLCDSTQKGLTKWNVSSQSTAFGFCAHKNEIVIVESILDDPKWDQLKMRSEINGYKACWSVPIPDPSGNSIGVVGVLCKHSRSPSVEELKHLTSSAFLAGMAITRKRYEEDLKNYSRELARSNQDLDEFASIASHDLQEPLRKVAAFGERLKKNCGDNLDERGKDYLDRMLRGTVRMQRFITDLLKYSRAGAKSGPLAPTDLNQLISDILVDFEFRIEETGAIVQVNPLPVIEGDGVQLRQVFANLIGNALKFIREGVTPQVTITTSTPNEHHLYIHVDDNGIGFDDSFSSRIFRPFERLNPNQAFEGSGMGLALCRKIVERHGGTISAASVPGRGTRITLEFPIGHKIN